jgi:hypothetical protein
MAMASLTGNHAFDATNPGGFYSNLERDHKANQVKFPLLFKGDAFRAGDVFHFVKSVKIYNVGGPSEMLVDAEAIVRDQDEAAIKTAGRSLLGAFTGPKGIAQALVRKMGGLQDDVPIEGLGPGIWDDFEVWRNGQKLGTAAHVRNHYYLTHKDSSNQQASKSATRTGNANAPTPTPANVTTVAPNPPDLSETLSNLNLTPPGQPPLLATALLPRAKPAKQSEKASDYQLENTLMRELFDVIPPTCQPERYNKKHTAIHAKDYIKFLQRRLDQASEMIRLMGVTEESLRDMVRQMDCGVEVADAMRNGLEWSDEGLLGHFGPEKDVSD